MKKENLEISIHQKLYQIAKDSDQDFNSLLIRYVQERFLYRLANSEYSDVFVLKGALLFTAFNLSSLRPTKDIDFLGRGVSSDTDTVIKIVRDICQINYPDAVLFDPESVQAVQIGKRNKYAGIRVKINAKLGTAKIVVWIDFGFGDKIVNGPVPIDFPTILDFEPPRILAYSLESAIAEKFQACVKLNFETSRLKDFYDIHELAALNAFSLSPLTSAIRKTFSARNTDLNESDILFKKEFKHDKKKEIQWRAFLTRTRLNSEFSFYELMDRIEKFLEPALIKKNSDKKWDFAKWKWV